MKIKIELDNPKRCDSCPLLAVELLEDNNIKLRAYGRSHIKLINQKKKQVKKYMAYAKKRGTLEGGKDEH